MTRISPSLAGRSPSGDGLAQSFQQSFKMRHAFAELPDLGANLSDLAAQPANLRLHVLAQPTNTREDQPSECNAHAENSQTLAAHGLLRGRDPQIGNGFHGLTMEYGFWYFI